MDAIALLKKDHREVEALFKRFEKAGDEATKLKRKIVDEVIVALSKHAAIEEAIFYPAARQALEAAGEENDIVLEAIEEHHVAKWLLEELRTLPADDERFDAKFTVLMENIRHHVKEEEQDFFPKVREVMGQDQLDLVGEALAQMKKVAPTRPHPRSPDAPPGNLVTAPVAAMMDRGVDLVKGVIAKRRKQAVDMAGKIVH